MEYKGLMLGQQGDVGVDTEHWKFGTIKDGVKLIDNLKKEQGNPFAEYEPDDDKIYIYSEVTHTPEQIIRSLLHEHTHTTQNQKEFKKLYDKGYQYSNHPFELEALEAEKNWKIYK